MQGGIADFTGLFTEDGAQQALFGRQFGFALGRNLTDENITGTDFGTFFNDTVGAEILQCVVTDVGHFTGDFFRSQFGIARFQRIFFNMKRSVHVFTNQALVQQDGVLVVITFPGHKADESVLTERYLAVGGGGTVGNDLPCFHRLSHTDNGTLVKAGALVGSLELQERIFVFHTVAAGNDDPVRVHKFNDAVVLCADNDTGVNGSLVFHTGTDNRGIRHHQRHSLLLHVGTHQCTGVIVVFQEGNHCRCDRHDHLRRNVHIVDVGSGYFTEDVLIVCRNLFVNEMIVGTERFVRLCDNVLIFHVGRHIIHFIGDNVVNGTVRQFDVGNAAVRRLDKAVVGNTGVGRQIRNQTDVRAFGGFNRAHTAVVRIVNVTNLERSTVTGQTAGTQCGQTALVRQFGKRVVLVHELGQLRRTEEFANSRRDGTNVNERLGRHLFIILRGHTFLNHLIHTGKTDAHLVLQLFTDRTNTAVPQMVDIIHVADVVRQPDHIADGSNYVVKGQALGTQRRNVRTYQFLNFFLIIPCLVHNGTERGNIAAFFHAAVFQIVAEQVLRINRVVGNNLQHAAVVENDFHVVYAGLLQARGFFTGQYVSFFEQNLTGNRADDRFRQFAADNTVVQRQFFIKFITADGCDVVPFRVKEIIVQQSLRRRYVVADRFAGTKLTVNLLQSFDTGRRVQFGSAVIALVNLHGTGQQFFVTVQVQNLLLGLTAEGTE